MTIEELVGEIIGTMPRLGWEDIKTAQGDNGNTLVVTFNTTGPTDVPFQTPGWFRSGPHADPTGKRQWKLDFTKRPM